MLSVLSLRPAAARGSWGVELLWAAAPPAPFVASISQLALHLSMTIPPPHSL
jgi:hypothetical protein